MAKNNIPILPAVRITIQAHERLKEIALAKSYIMGRTVTYTEIISEIIMAMPIPNPHELLPRRER